MLIGNEVELENETSFVLRVFVSYCKQQIDANVQEKSNTWSMDFLVLMKSIERNVCHSPDVLLAHFLITAVLVSWSLFLELV